MIHLSEKQTKYMWDAYHVIIKRRRKTKVVLDIEKESSILIVVDTEFHENEKVSSNYKLKILSSILIPITTMFFLVNDITKIKYKDIIESLATFIEDRTMY